MTSSDPSQCPDEDASRTRDLRTIEGKWQERWGEAAPRPRHVAPPDREEGTPEPGSQEERSQDAPPDERSTRRDGGEQRPRPYYCLDMFPYPSLGGFSVNQLRGIAITDVVARYQEARGREVLRPMGWDSFGLSIEQEAEAHGIAPHEVVERGIAIMREQLRAFGARVDWDRELRTSDPEFYRWTQWIFLKMLDKGIAFRQELPIKWCPSCGMNLANEELEEGRCLHCRTDAEERRISQWMLRISEYSERLHQGLRTLKWPRWVKAMQRNWIGRREGYRLTLKASSEFLYRYEELDVFVRRLEWIPAATYLVIAPEHPLLETIVDELYREPVLEYRDEVVRRTERERLSSMGVPEGQPTGGFVLNPVTLQRIPVWVSSFVLPEVRFGALLAVPGHDERHHAFAKHFDLQVRKSVILRTGRRRRERGRHNRGDHGREQGRRGSDGGPAKPEEVMVNSGTLSGMPRDKACRIIRRDLEGRGVLNSHVDYHLRDWIFARQRYWGEPIPVVYDEDQNPVPVPEKDLPVVLPLLDKVPPAEGGQGPLHAVDSFRLCELPAALAGRQEADPDRRGDDSRRPLERGDATRDAAPDRPPREDASAWDRDQEEDREDRDREQEEYFSPEPRRGFRETDTMPQWVASCWYYLRYLTPHDSTVPFSREQARGWLPVDLCVGGIEHAILHLLYVRFFSYFLYDIGETRHEEPFRKVFNQGRIYRKAPDRQVQRIATHRGDRIEAGPYLEQYGGDTLRLHLMFLAPPSEDVVWSDSGLRGCRRLLRRCLEVVAERKEKGRFVSRQILVEKHRLIRRVTRAIETIRLNKAISAFMEFIKCLRSPAITLEEVDRATLRVFSTLLAPFAPHVAEECWEMLGGPGSVFEQEWPEYSKELLKPLEVEIGVMVDGKIRDRFTVDSGISRSELLQMVHGRERVQAALAGRSAARTIVVPDRLVKFVLPEELETAESSGSPEPPAASSPAAAGPPPDTRLDPPRNP